MKFLIKSALVPFFRFYFKTFRYAGALFLVLLIECICLAVYCDNELGMAEVESEALQITEVMVEKGLGREKDAGYHFYLTLKNNGSSRSIASGNFIKNDEGYSISSEDTGVYQGIDNWGSLYSGVIVPPGSEATADVFVKKETLEWEGTEYLIFKAGLDGEEFRVPISDLQME